LPSGLALGSCLFALGHVEERQAQEAPVPTLLRFLAVIAILAGLVFAAMFALATFVEPESRDITVTIPFNRLQPK
jgi:hypothetical protein